MSIVVGLVIATLHLWLVACVGLFAWEEARRSAHAFVRRGLTDLLDSGLPLEPGLLALSAVTRGRTARRLGKLAEMLRQGRPLPDALDAIPKLASPSFRFLLRTGLRTGRLDEALAEGQRQAEHTDNVRRALAGKAAYMALLLFAFVGFVAVLRLFIAPRLQSVLAEFGTELPALTEQLVFAAAPLGLGRQGLRWVVAGVVLAVVAVTTLLALVRNSARLTGRLLREDVRSTLEALRLGLAAGLPMPQVLRFAADENPYPHLRRRLGVAAETVAAGAAWPQAVAGPLRLRRAEVALLEGAQAGEDLDAALSQVAAVIRQRAGFRTRLTVKLLWPMLVIAFATVYGLFALALFLPLVRLIEQMLP